MLLMLVAYMALSQAAFAAACKMDDGSDGHLVTFINKSNEPLVIGVLGSIFDANDERISDDTGYAHPKNWELGAQDGSTLTWCAPQHFNGRFFARTSCVDGKCKTGDCCKGGSCPGNVCTKTADPTSLAEIFVDSLQGTYYDISFVDGYDFPLLMKPVNMTANDTNKISCEQAGCETTPLCPWGLLVNGTCQSPYNQFELDYSDYQYQPDYYPLAAMCVQNMFKTSATDPGVCGCGKTKDCKLNACPTSKEVKNPFSDISATLYSSGCSPLNENYNNAGEGNGTEQYQITCDPSSNETKTSYGTDCHPWPAAYKKYVTNINTACGINGTTKTKGVYTWQYDDKHGLFQCANSTDMGFEITILPRDKKTPQASMVTFNPGYKDSSNTTPVTGTIVRGGQTYYLQGPDPLKLAVKNGDALKLELNCSDQGFSMTCNMTYKDNITGFVVDLKTSAPVCANPKNFPDWGKTTIGLGFPDSTWCSSNSTYRLQISPAGDAGIQGHVCIGNQTTPKSFSPKANPPIEVFIPDNSLFRLVQYCGLDSKGAQRIIACSADFTLEKGFFVKTISGASSVCTDGRIDWKSVFANKNLGLAKWVTDVDCVKEKYVETCPATYTQQDAQSGLQIHNNLPTAHGDPLKLDNNKDGRIDQIDVINMLRRSMGN